MKTIVFLFEGTKSSYQFENSFNSQSAFYRALSWARKVDDVAQVVVLTVPETGRVVAEQTALFTKNENWAVPVEFDEKNFWTTALLLHELAQWTTKTQADYAVYAWGDCPFLDEALTREVTAAHIKYLSEYTFADGYPYGFAPEVLARGALAILASLAEGVQKEAGDEPVTKTSIFSVMKGDVNSFEVETVIAPKDWRQLRLDFSCSTKATFLACCRLYQAAMERKIPLTAVALTTYAEKAAPVQQTVPAYYSVQIAGGCTTSCKYCPYPKAVAAKYGADGVRNMSLDSFKTLLPQMVSLSDTAVVGLSAWGEALLHPQFCAFVEAVLSYQSLSVLIETDGTLVTPALAAAVARTTQNALPRTNGQQAVTWIVSLDAQTQALYDSIHAAKDDGLEKSSFSRATDAVELLESFFPGEVYPQFLRVNENECELESFYRYWHDKTHPSKGRLIIQKYDSFCGLLSDEKPADLSPLERNPCWHVKRDMVILADGGVPFCREALLDAQAGNVFNEGIEAVWSKFGPVVAQQIDKNYNDRCKACDEYYTFNF